MNNEKDNDIYDSRRNNDKMVMVRGKGREGKGREFCKENFTHKICSIKTERKNVSAWSSFVPTVTGSYKIYWIILFEMHLLMLNIQFDICDLIQLIID
ncbi:hypothetical protein T07_2888 [Trichinella nelsoni]|uniref:Uncharacterized protein n=1 Tax=Trichinella nelsoni TaxID=6336 RepID=A0A0V0RM71_9BILA|nr:hypothetical protein T07_2888 [Trichinella nelsoni]